MKQTAFLLKSLLLTAMMGCTLSLHAQRYEIDHGRVFFGGKMVMHADVRSFVDLGFGYAKDRDNVYMDGRILENVEPSSFRLKESSTWRQRGHNDMDDRMSPRSYYKTQFNVYYGDRKIDAVPSRFEELDYGYAKDAFSVFYLGEKLSDAMSATFQVLEGGYAKDSFNVYYYGKKVKGAVPSSFRCTGNGYAQDAFNVFYRGKMLR